MGNHNVLCHSTKNGLNKCIACLTTDQTATQRHKLAQFDDTAYDCKVFLSFSCSRRQIEHGNSSFATAVAALVSHTLLRLCNAPLLPSLLLTATGHLAAHPHSSPVVLACALFVFSLLSRVAQRPTTATLSDTPRAPLSSLALTAVERETFFAMRQPRSASCVVK